MRHSSPLHDIRTTPQQSTTASSLPDEIQNKYYFSPQQSGDALNQLSLESFIYSYLEFAVSGHLLVVRESPVPPKLVLTIPLIIGKLLNDSTAVI